MTVQLNGAPSVPPINTIFTHARHTLVSGKDKLKALVIKVCDFIKRHKKSFLLYGAVALTMAGCRIGAQKIALTLLPGFGYMLAFSSGSEIPSDFLQKHKIEVHSENWLPKEECEAVGDSLKTRWKTADKIKTHLRTRPPLGWTLMHGRTGAGKSSALQAISGQLTEEGHAVYHLKTNTLKSGPVRGMLDSRFTVLATYLNGLALTQKKTPVLVIDEFQRMVDPSSPGFNDCLKDSSNFPMRFNILAATTTDDLSRLSDQAVLRRFDGRKFPLAPLDQAGIVETLKHVKRSSFEQPVSDELIAYAAQKVTGIDRNLQMTRAVSLIKRACEAGVPSREEVDRQIALLDDAGATE